MSEATAADADTPDTPDNPDTNGAPDTDTDAGLPTTGVTRDRRWWHGDRSVLIAAGIVALGIVLVLRGVLAGVTGEDRAALPDAVEELNPVPEAVQVLSQTSIFVDLAANHTGELIIDGVEIETISVDEVGRIDVEPGQQVDLPPATIYEPGNATLTYIPSSGAPIEEFAEGEHRVVLRFWSIDDGPQRARTYTWTFNVL